MKPFYGKVIARGPQQRFIQDLLRPFLRRPATDELRKEVYDLLMHEKHLGRVTIPFEVVMRKAPPGEGVDYIEVILDSKV